MKIDERFSYELIEKVIIPLTTMIRRDKAEAKKTNIPVNYEIICNGLEEDEVKMIGRMLKKLTKIQFTFTKEIKDEHS